MTILTAMYEKEAYDQGHQTGYDEGYAAGHLAARVQHIQEGEGLVRAGIMQSLKDDYERRIEKAYEQGRRDGARTGYDKGYLDGKADGYEEGAAAGRRERLEFFLTGDAEEVQALPTYESLAMHLRQVLAQVKEGGPIAVAISERIEDAIAHHPETL